MTKDTRASNEIALLIDAENIVDPDQISYVFAELEQQGNISIRRAYADWSGMYAGPDKEGWDKYKKEQNRKKWQKITIKHNIKTENEIAIAPGKSSTDMRIAIDAMEILFKESPDAFAIVSSDSDYAVLVSKLRSSGKSVYGFGAATSVKNYQESYSKFFVLPQKVDNTPRTPVQDQGTPGELQPVIDNINKVISEVQDHGTPGELQPVIDNINKVISENGGSVLMAHLGNKLPELKENGYFGHPSLKEFLGFTGLYELQREGLTAVYVKNRDGGESSVANMADKPVLDAQTEDPGPEVDFVAPDEYRSRRTINPEKIRFVIGPGGSNIRQLAGHGGRAHIYDDGTVSVFGCDHAAAAKIMIQKILDFSDSLKDYKKLEMTETGDLPEGLHLDHAYEAEVIRMEEKYAIIMLPAVNGTGILHVRNMADGYTEKASDILQLGQMIRVCPWPSENRLEFSMKAAAAATA